MKPIAIIGSGNSGLAMAAHLSLNNNAVRLWNRSADTIQQLKKTNTIHCNGVVEGAAHIETVTNDLAAAVDDVQLILVTTPADSHREIAGELAPYLKQNPLIVLNPGRTFGALEFTHTLKNSPCQTEPLVAETQTIVYTCRKNGPDSVIILQLKKEVLICGIDPRNNKMIIDTLPACLKQFFVPAKSMIETSIGNVGMILHCLPVLLNIGWIESPRTQFKYYYEGITPTIAEFLEDLDRERVEVSCLLGVPVGSTADWLKRSYGVTGDNLYDCIQANDSYKTIHAPLSLQHRYIYDDITCGLVPLEAIGKFLGLPMKLTGLVIDLASRIMKEDFRGKGRTLKSVDLKGKTIDELQNYFKPTHP